MEKINAGELLKMQGIEKKILIFNNMFNNSNA